MRVVRMYLIDIVVNGWIAKWVLKREEEERCVVQMEIPTEFILPSNAPTASSGRNFKRPVGK